MSLYEFLSLAISLIAAIIAVLALGRSATTMKRQLELEERHAVLAEKQLETIRRNEEDQSKAKIDVELDRIGTDGIFYVSNIGAASAFDVRFDIEPDDPVFPDDLTERFPAKELRPGKVIEIRAAFTMGSPTKYVASVSWANPDGNEKNDRFELHL